MTRDAARGTWPKENILGKKILAVNDSFTIRQQVSGALNAAGFDVSEAVDSMDGIAKVDGASDTSLVICDISMPRMDGLDMLDMVHAEHRRPAIPFMMLTTEGKPDLTLQRQHRSGRIHVVDESTKVNGDQRSWAGAVGDQ